VIETTLDDLASELRVAGVGARGRARVVLEARDHLEEAAARMGDEQAVRAFGAPREVARLVAAEIATTASRTATLATFGVLAVTGVVYAVLFLTLRLAGSPDVFGGSIPAVGLLSLAGIVFAPQVAFVSGMLALLRVARMRRRGALPAAELRVQRWRTGVALSAGIATLASLAVAALDFRHDLAGWWVATALVSAAVLTTALLAVSASAARSAHVQALEEGAAEDVFADIAPVLRRPALERLALPSHPWRFAWLVGGGAAFAVELAGIVAGDPFDGLVRAAAELLALLGCFGLLGRRLGLRR
jgi:hypothetical protein